ncbi:MAG: hypothetical protein J6O61_09965 [Butyrivibrio sp.]|uniref:hypothetical protein n=1 Tax=Butyrivibrio sp. TaxID=28121 RepID=UPI001B2E8F01|nr:hypothetical protein [Butyrivibrio sp.]MBO6241133.1 hypothetical protein [Butyrivibrio sp.]
MKSLLIGKNILSITRSTIELAFINAMKEQEIAGCVKGPKKLGCFGASYLYGMFLKWEIFINY